jgi:hypothetical protein
LAKNDVGNGARSWPKPEPLSRSVADRRPEALSDPALGCGEVLEHRLRPAGNVSEPDLQVPLTGQLLMKLAQAHQHGYEDITGQDEPSFPILTARSKFAAG